jgi:hypothetical protein
MKLFGDALGVVVTRGAETYYRKELLHHVRGAQAQNALSSTNRSRRQQGHQSMQPASETLLRSTPGVHGTETDASMRWRVETLQVRDDVCDQKHQHNKHRRRPTKANMNK